MRFVSIDIETTGLIPTKHMILEIGAVIGDFVTPVDQFSTFRRVICRELIVGHPYALDMNAALIKEIAHRSVGGYVDSCRQAYRDMKLWLLREGFPVTADQRVKFTAAGKNFAGFDLPFLRGEIGEVGEVSWDAEFVVKHRVFDPGSLYFRHGDDVIPDLATCMKRAGIEGVVTHTAIDDALNVVKVLRAFYGSPEK